MDSFQSGCVSEREPGLIPISDYRRAAARMLGISKWYFEFQAFESRLAIAMRAHPVEVRHAV